MRDGAFHPLHLIDDDLLEFAAGSINDRTKRHSRKLGKDLLPYRGKQGKGCPVADAQSHCIEETLKSETCKCSNYVYKVITPCPVSGYHS